MIIPARHHRGREKRRPTGRHGDVPPAVAALLAVTTIPPPASRKSSKSTVRRKASELFDREPKMEMGTFLGDDDAFAIDFADDLPENASKNPLLVLLSSPEREGVTMERSDSEGRLSVRSISTESVPSLETDDESTLSSSLNSTYSPWRRGTGLDARARIVSPPPEDCLLDHPLLSPVEEPPPPKVPSETSFLGEETLKRVSRRLNLKSNLTASIRVLKSAAKSFSSLSTSAASVQPDDYLTRSILSITPQYRDEKRPLPCDHEPTPALRRYLNPWNATYDDSPCTGAIQMQTYSALPKPGDDEFLAAAQLACGPVGRPREIRENGDFLRIIVLEMNMRREGKLSDAAQGKARLVLPPRQPCKFRASDPGRWTPLACVYEE
jgi:hypothetical protein